MEDETTKTEGIKETATDLVDHVTDFLETYYQYISVNVAQKSVNLASGAINFVVIIFLCLLVVSFLGFGLAWWLGTVIDNRAGGFFLVAAVYLIIMIAIIVMRKKLIFPFLRNVITRKIYE
jgi:Putative Actinobacterial Holin-X, holin superfamily III